MEILPTIFLKKKKEPLLPQTIQTTVLSDPDNSAPGKEKSAVTAKVSPGEKTKKKKKCLDGATSVVLLFTLLWLTFGRLHVNNYTFLCQNIHTILCPQSTHICNEHQQP